MFTSNQSLYSQYEGLDSNRRQIIAAIKQKDSFADHSINLKEMRFSGNMIHIFMTLRIISEIRNYQIPG
jgi:hypothetical protein